MKLQFNVAIVAIASIMLAACGGAPLGGGGARDYITVVGSSTVYPFATAVSEALVRSQQVKSPVIEATGTGAGIKLFCSGIGVQFPDVVNASRRLKKSEYEACAANGVNEVVEIQVGLDGIAFAEARNGLELPLTPTDVYKALAAAPYGRVNTARTWQQVNPRFPAVPILVYGPPSTSGTRDALAELILTKGCESDARMKALKDSNADEHKRLCTGVRTDGAYVEQGENDNLIVQKIAQNPRAVGVFGFSFLEENFDKLRGNPMNGIAPTYQTVSDFTYPGARPLYIYIKAAHLRSIRGLREFAAEWTNAWGPEGMLKRKGMVIAPDDVRARNQAIAQAMTLLDPSTLK